MVLPVALVLLQVFVPPPQPLYAPATEPVEKTAILAADVSARLDIPRDAAVADPAGEAAPSADVEQISRHLYVESTPNANGEQQEESSSSVTVAAPANVILSSEAAARRRLWDQRQRRMWLGLSIAQSGAAIFDAWSTRRVVASGRGSETNPMLRPFAGNGSMYAAVQVGPLLLDVVARRMLTSRHTWMRRTWWIPQTVGTMVSVSCGAGNLGVYNRAH
jgi:hypothetical protein